jgi:hypothetical protein
MPKLASVKAVGRACVEVKWKSGSRARKTEVIDLSPLVKSFKFYKPLRDSPAAFRTVRLIDSGEAVAWNNGEIDMAATSIERLAEEAMSPSDLRAFLKRHHLTQEGAAALLGRSRRQIANYLAGTRIPRLVALACFGISARLAAA